MFENSFKSLITLSMNVPYIHHCIRHCGLTEFDFACIDDALDRELFIQEPETQ